MKRIGAIGCEQRCLTSRARPTAVNLRWAVERVEAHLNESDASPDTLEALAIRIHDEDIAACHRMGELGAREIGQATGVMTHCNAGALATGGYRHRSRGNSFCLDRWECSACVCR